MLKAILIDVGGPLIVEDEFYRMSDEIGLGLLRENGYQVPPEEFQEVLQRFIALCLPRPRAAALWHFVRPDVERFAEIRRAFHAAQQEWFRGWERRKLRPGAKEAVERLSESYQLALAGNQLIQAKKFLDSQGILQHFQFSFVSEEMEASKPDPLFFQIILSHLSIQPDEAIMVGDRLDSDIYPAKLLGIKTIRVLAGPYALQEPQTPFHEPDTTISSIADLPQAVERLANV
jgi:HAD superfamily hydrolase (TIGR01549 family)